jgi:hypothetical protein
MARYRIHRIRETVKEQFRWAAHTGGTAIVKPKDYDFDSELEGATPYAMWSTLKAEGNNLCPGDVLEMVNGDGTQGELQIFKYIGFEPATWWIPEPKAEQQGKFDDARTSVAATPNLHSH